MPEAPEPTICFSALQFLPCPHCEAETVQVIGGSGINLGEYGSACLQCIADGKDCCSLEPLNRWRYREIKRSESPESS